MFRVHLGLLACTLLVAVAGCGAGSDGAADKGGPPGSAGGKGPASGGVAIVDLDLVAKRLGRDVAMGRLIENGRASLNQQLQDLQVSLNEKYEAKKLALNAEPPQNPPAEGAQTDDLAKLQRQLNFQLAQARRSAQSEINNYGRRLIQQFRAEVTPAAEEVAAARGLGVVVTKNDNVLLTFNPAHDITDEVIAKLRQRAATSGGAAVKTAARPAAAPATRR